MVDEELKQMLEAMRRENADAHAETRRYVDASAEETRRHVGLALERQRDELKFIAEGVTMLAERMDRRDAHVDEVTTDLDRRVTRLEAKSPRR